MDAAARASLKRNKAAGEAELEIQDVLKAMSQTLIKEGSTVYHVPQSEDPPARTYAEDRKPPKEIFYRQTTTFATQLPAAVLPKRCTCQYLCTGAPAEYKCLSCVMYDPKGVGFFCKLCFDARHPWYRVGHMYIDIDRDESIAHTIKVGHRRAEMIRYEREGIDLLKRVAELGPKIEYIADDVKVEGQLKSAGHKAQTLQARIHLLRRDIRADCRAKGLAGLALNDDEAAVLLGKTWRGWRVRRNYSIILISRLRHASNGGYLDTADGRVFSRKPRLLLHCHTAYVQREEK